jgi:hypothetical protein
MQNTSKLRACATIIKGAIDNMNRHDLAFTQITFLQKTINETRQIVEKIEQAQVKPYQIGEE